MNSVAAVRFGKRYATACLPFTSYAQSLQRATSQSGVKKAKSVFAVKILIRHIVNAPRWADFHIFWKKRWRQHAEKNIFSFLMSLAFFQWSPITVWKKSFFFFSMQCFYGPLKKVSPFYRWQEVCRTVWLGRLCKRVCLQVLREIHFCPLLVVKTAFCVKLVSSSCYFTNPAVMKHQKHLFEIMVVSTWLM